MHRVVSREQWIAERQKLLAEEKAFTRQRDALAEKRRALPWVRVDKGYEFDSPQGRVTLADLFRGTQPAIRATRHAGSRISRCNAWAARSASITREPAAASRESRRVRAWRSRAPRCRNSTSAARTHGLAHCLSIRRSARTSTTTTASRSNRRTWPRAAPSTTTVLRSRHRRHFRKQRLLQGRVGEHLPHVFELRARRRGLPRDLSHPRSHAPGAATRHGPYISLTDWARPHNMYGKGGEVAPNGRYTPPVSCCM